MSYQICLLTVGVTFMLPVSNWTIMSICYNDTLLSYYRVFLCSNLLVFYFE